jgi:hypothetical protein
VAESLISHVCTEIERPETLPRPYMECSIRPAHPPFGKKKSMK